MTALFGNPFATNEGIVGVSVLIEDIEAGEYTLTLGFEPSLGVRRTQLTVVPDGTARAGVRVPVPGGTEGCRGGVWPVDNATVACEQADAGISLFSSDAGRRGFPGAALVVAGGSIWSVAQNTLERRVLNDGVINLEGSFPDVAADDFPGEHSADDALRRSTQREVIRAVADAGARPIAPIQEARGVYAAIATETWFWHAWMARGCGMRLTCPENVRAVEPEVIWYAASDGSLEAKPRTGNPDIVTWRIPRPAPAVEIPRAGFAVAPLWLPTAAAGLDALVTADLGHLSMIAWPRERVLGRNHEFVVVREVEGDAVRVYSLNAQ